MRQAVDPTANALSTVTYPVTLRFINTADLIKFPVAKNKKAPVGAWFTASSLDTSSR